MNIPEKSAKDGGKSTDFKKLNSTLEPVCYDLQAKKHYNVNKLKLFKLEDLQIYSRNAGETNFRNYKRSLQKQLCVCVCERESKVNKSYRA